MYAGTLPMMWYVCDISLPALLLSAVLQLRVTAVWLPTTGLCQNCPSAYARTSRRTDGRTPYRYIDAASHTMTAVSVTGPMPSNHKICSRSSWLFPRPILAFFLRVFCLPGFQRNVSVVSAVAVMLPSNWAEVTSVGPLARHSLL